MRVRWAEVAFAGWGKNLGFQHLVVEAPVGHIWMVSCLRQQWFWEGEGEERHVQIGFHVLTEVHNHVCPSLVEVVVWEGQWHRFGALGVTAESAAVWPRVEAHGQKCLVIWRVVGSCSISAQDRISIIPFQAIMARIKTTHTSIPTSQIWMINSPLPTHMLPRSYGHVSCGGYEDDRGVFWVGSRDPEREREAVGLTSKGHG